MAPDRVIIVIGSGVDEQHIRRLATASRDTSYLVMNVDPTPSTDSYGGNCLSGSALSACFNNFSDWTHRDTIVAPIRGGFRDLSPAQVLDDAERSRLAMANWRRRHQRILMPKCIRPRNVHRFRPVHQPRWSAKRWRSTT